MGKELVSDSRAYRNSVKIEVDHKKSPLRGFRRLEPSTSMSTWIDINIQHIWHIVKT